MSAVWDIGLVVDRFDHWVGCLRSLFGSLGYVFYPCILVINWDHNCCVEGRRKQNYCADHIGSEVVLAEESVGVVTKNSVENRLTC